MTATAEQAKQAWRGAAAGRRPAAAAGPRPDTRTFLEDLAADLSRAAGLLTLYAEADAARREALSIAPATAPQLAALIAARRARNAAFALDLANPGWSLLLELYRAHLAGQPPCRRARLATDARLAMTTATRWLGLLRRAGLAERPAAGGYALTPAGVEAMADYFTAARTGWNAG
jgi:hypothetical protein